MRRMRNRVLTSVTVVLMALLLVPATALGGTAETGERAASVYGAIAVDSGFRQYQRAHYGWSYNWGTPAGARRTALRYCRQYSAKPRTCQVVATVRNRCVAVAHGYDASGQVLYRAVRKAASKRAAQRRAVLVVRGVTGVVDVDAQAVCARG